MIFVNHLYSNNLISEINKYQEGKENKLPVKSEAGTQSLQSYPQLLGTRPRVAPLPGLGL